MNRPTVTATHHTPCITNTRVTGVTYTTPGVTLEVEFELHDHAAALAMLELAVADVRDQIKETQ